LDNRYAADRPRFACEINRIGNLIGVENVTR
jgi:hypothetical protein